MYEVIVLSEGYSDTTLNGSLSNSSCTLIRGPKNIIVDTMTPWDRKTLLEAMEDIKMSCDEINYVVCTHGHSDHVGNNNLFLKAKQHIIGRCVSYKQLYYDDDKFFNSDGVYAIDTDVRIVSTPGHTLTDVSVIVETSKGTYGITGDLFEKEADIMDESIWLKAGSEDPDSQRANRKLIMDQVDWIIPGHGRMFSTRHYK